ncbi:hypothetical protein L873DRAFT_1840235 [Choiromyces venosus 120613-1]|uniref:DDE-1 domain-containing protein n=1 Tax=Choiromyces venosus 120613-1 TaxID=1336337 RepID=A0A3N4K6H6_9PEZI|nr:hypothetical protein L873DRAFT_1840235 [Choiromyces venosus 120613-1]
MASTAVKMFDVNPSSIRTRQLHRHHQERNSRGIFNSHGGNNLILTNAQEQAVSRFCLEQLEMCFGATPSILYATICHLRQQEKKNPPSLRWFQLWIKKIPHLHSIKTKPIAQTRITTHSEEDVKDFFVEYQNTVSKYGIKRAKYIFNMDESGVRIGCPTGEIIIVLIQVKELYTASLENHKSLTIIETICADGREPPPLVIICPGEKIMENCIQDNLTGAEKARKQQVKAIQIRGEIVPAEMLVTIPYPERDPSPEDLESLQAPPDLLQALLLLEPTPSSATSTIDPQLLALDFEEEDIEIYTNRREAEQRYTTESTSGENSFTVDDGEDLTGESDSDSSCISSDSIIRNANFVSLN